MNSIIRIRGQNFLFLPFFNTTHDTIIFNFPAGIILFFGVRSLDCSGQRATDTSMASHWSYIFIFLLLTT